VTFDGDNLNCLVGEELNAVSFVLDYVEFHFNGPVLRALSNPIVQSESMRGQFPEPGSRDALCALIGAKIAHVNVRQDDRIELRTTRGETLAIPIDQQSRRGAEAAQFVPADKFGRLRIADMLIW
jgi:hypothetical protein